MLMDQDEKNNLLSVNAAVSSGKPIFRESLGNNDVSPSPGFNLNNSRHYGHYFLFEIVEIHFFIKISSDCSTP
jgi:hypothetical protein